MPANKPKVTHSNPDGSGYLWIAAGGAHLAVVHHADIGDAVRRIEQAVDAAYAAGLTQAGEPLPGDLAEVLFRLALDVIDLRNMTYDENVEAIKKAWREYLISGMQP